MAEIRLNMQNSVKTMRSLGLWLRWIVSKVSTMMEVLFRKSKLPSLTVECQPATIVLDRHTSFFLKFQYSEEQHRKENNYNCVPDTVLCFKYKYRFFFVV